MTEILAWMALTQWVLSWVIATLLWRILRAIKQR